VFFLAGDKRPLKGSHGHKDATADPAKIQRLFQKHPGGVGIGAPVPEGEFVVDIDPRSGGDEMLAGLIKEHGPLPATVTTLSGGKDGGQHLRFRLPPGVWVNSRHNKLGQGLDVKAAGQGYVVLPPSPHPSGGIYRWRPFCSPEEQAVAEAPAWMLDLLTREKPREAGKEGKGSGKNYSEWLKGIPQGEPGGRDFFIYQFACRLRRDSVPYDGAKVLVLEAARNCRPAYEASRAVEKLERAFKFPEGDSDSPTDDREWSAFVAGADTWPEQAEPGLVGTAEADWEPEAGDGGPAVRSAGGNTGDPASRPPGPAAFLRAEPRNLIRLVTDFPTLNAATRGGIPTGIVFSVIGAPHTGKTAILSQLALRAASEGYLVVALFKDEGRFAASVRLGQQLGLDRTRLENQDPRELDDFDSAMLDRSLVTPDADSEDWTLEKTIRWAEAEAGATGKTLLLLTDSIQSVYAECAENRRALREEIEAKMRLLEGAAKRGALCVVTSEMNRSAYKNKDTAENTKGIAAGAEGRAIEYVSRLIITLEGDAEKVITAQIEKNSPGGKRPILSLKFDPATARFREIREEEAEELADEVRRKEEEARDAKLRDGIRRALSKHTELNARGLSKEVGGRREALAEVRDEMVAAGQILERVEGQAKFYRRADIQ